MAYIIRKRGIYRHNFPGKAEFVKRVEACFEQARQLFYEFNLADDDIPIVFFSKGQKAGQVQILNNVYNIEFNVDAIHKDWNKMINDAIPHEVAHIVDHYIHGKFNNHNQKWKYIARKLGCTGDRCHTMKLEKARRRRKAMYVATCGTEIWVSINMHNKIQQGNVRILRKTKGILTRDHFTGNVAAF